MIQKHKTLLATGGVILAVAIGIASWWLVNREAPAADIPATSQGQPTENPEKTIATAWQWDGFETREQTADNTPADKPGEEKADEESARSVQFDVTLVYDKLQGVRLDSDGNVIKDETALRALHDVFSREEMQELTQADLAQLQELIRIGLPGKAGQQTAQVVGDFHEYLQAKDEFEALYQGQHSTEEMQMQYRELQALRRLYLGDEVAESLFAERDRASRFMMESMALARDDQLSDEERRAKQQALSEEFHDVAPDINNWDSRYAQYQQQQTLIRDAGLTPEEERRQLRELRGAHFSPDEIAAAKKRGFLALPDTEDGATSQP